MAHSKAELSAYLDSRFVIKIAGKAVEDKLLYNLIEVIVDQSLYIPSMFTMWFYDDDLAFLDEKMFDLGAAVEIRVGDKLLIKGEITALEPHYNDDGKATFVVRGYDQAHRLHRGRHTRTFMKQKDSDIAKTLAGEANLKTKITATNITHEYLVQNNQTNMEFLSMRAEVLGYQLFIKENTLYFMPDTKNEGDAPELLWPYNLRSFQPRISSNLQTDKVQVIGWDADTKKIIKGEAKPDKKLNQGGLKKTGGDTTKASFGQATTTVTNYPIDSADEAKALATSIANEQTRNFLEAEGYALGDPELVAGLNVNIGGLGDRFSGIYFLTSTTHNYKNGRYYTYFSVSGRRPTSIEALLGQNESHSNQHWGRQPHLVTGIVTNTKDDKNLGRIKVSFPWMLDNSGVEIESNWARLVPPMAGANKKGFYYIPDVNDEVLVGFEHGDMRYPYILGALWNNTDKPPDTNANVAADGKTNQWIIRTRSGHIITLDDTEGKENIAIVDKTQKNFIKIDTKSNSLTIKVDKDITIKAGGKINISAGGDIAMESKNWNTSAQQSAKLEAMQKIDLKATQKVSIKGTAGVEVSGAMIDVKGDAKVGIQGSAMVEVKGGLIKLN